MYHSADDIVTMFYTMYCTAIQVTKFSNMYHDSAFLLETLYSYTTVVKSNNTLTVTYIAV